MTPDPIAPLGASLNEFLELVNGVGDRQWEARTPCQDWSVHDLVNHFVSGNLLVASLLSGAERRPPGELARWRAQDFLGTDAGAAVGSSADAVVEALRAPGALERTIVMPIGTVPGAAVAGLRLTETITHGWDLAVATGQSAGFDDGAIAAATAFTISALSDLPPTNRAFGPSTEPPEDASPLQKLVSLLGRDAEWTPPAA